MENKNFDMKELIEKATPKTPEDIDEKQDENFYWLGFICPNCKTAIIGQPYRPNYCKHCGQALKWED